MPTPAVTLIDPAPEATGVLRKIGTIGFEVMSGGTTATRVGLKPEAGRTIYASGITVIGRPGPNGQVSYSAAFPDVLASRTTYHVFVSGIQTFSGCGTRYRSPSSFFKTGTKRK